MLNYLENSKGFITILLISERCLKMVKQYMLKTSSSYLKAWIKQNNEVVITLLIILILVVSVSLRFFGLDIQSLWRDELSTYDLSSYNTFKEVIINTINRDVNPPAYYVIIFFVIKIFGSSEVMLRLPSAISGVLAVFGIFLVGRSLYSAKEGLTSAALMAVSWTPIYYSQEARSYMIMIFAIIFATYYWLKILSLLNLEQKIPLKLYVFYILFAVLSCYLHYFGLFFIVFQGILSVILFLRKYHIRIVILIYLVITFAYLPWFPTLVSKFLNNQGSNSWIPFPTSDVIWGFVKFVFAPSSLVTIIICVLILVYLVHRVFSLGFKYGSATDIYHDKLNKLPISADLLLVLWLAVPVIVIYLVSLMGIKLFLARYLIIVLPAAYLLLSRSIFNFPLHIKTIKVLFAVLLVLFLLFNLVCSWGYYLPRQKEPFRETALFINQNDINNSFILSNVGPKIGFDYYFSKLGSLHKVDLELWGSENPEMVINKFITENNASYIWYISQRYSWDDTGIKKYLEKSFLLVRKENIFSNDTMGFEIYLYSIPKTEVDP